MKFILFIIIALLFTTPAYPAVVCGKFLTAIHATETNKKRGAILGDHGRALGPLQIHRNYFNDASEFDPTLGDNYADVANLQFAQRVVTAYLNRYARSAVVRKDYATMARVHNGGPDGMKNKSTWRYWIKLKKNLS
jgi:hypothetical protein